MQNINAIFALTRADKGSVIVTNDEVIEIKIKKSNVRNGLADKYKNI